MEQLCCGARENGDPNEGAQLSCSVKLGSPLKSLTGKFVLPGCDRKARDRPLSVDPEGSLLVSVMVCNVGVDPKACGGKVRNAGESEIGCVQAVVFPNPRQMFARSPGTPIPGHALVVTP